MDFTKAQKQALWFITLVLAAAVGLRYYQYFTENDSYDFSALERRFVTIRDSLNNPVPGVKEGVASIIIPGESRINKIDKGNSPAERININTAGTEQLTRLPRIGPVMAGRIIEYRQKNGRFLSKKEIMKVKGIGKKTFEKLKDLISLDGE